MTGHILRSGRDRYQLRLAPFDFLNRRRVDPARGEVLRFPDLAGARDFFLELMGDFSNRGTLEEFVLSDFCRLECDDLRNADETELADALGQALVAGKIRVVRLLEGPARDG